MKNWRAPSARTWPRKRRCDRTGTDLLHVPYKGSAPAKAAVMANEVSMTFEPAFTGMPQITAGKLRALAGMSDKRSAVLPDVPTTAD